MIHLAYLLLEVNQYHTSNFMKAKPKAFYLGITKINITYEKKYFYLRCPFNAYFRRFWMQKK
ncbi:hypothetical protein AD998_12705 [bacterium 336/3]|nr:hypothetical protein AD998_12705 [bacterium 336/3]